MGGRRVERSVVVAETKGLAVDLSLEGVVVVDWTFRGVLAWDGGADGKAAVLSFA